ncbi:MAG TPA: PKD domain-containing protein [Methanoregulaceae archaeon]|nr:PKD domain-containing protein [Methanoregulaceae archaeon]
MAPGVIQATGTAAHPDQEPIADFTANQTSGRVPFPVKFFDISSLGPTNWSWDFGDGNFSNETNPVHVYLTPGTYQVKLIASNGAGSNMVRKSYYITAMPEFQAPFAGFGIKPQEMLSDTIQFTDQSGGPAKNWSWNFGDGGTSNIQNPIHSFSGPGNYMVTLTVSNPVGSSTITHEFLLGGAPGTQPSSANTPGSTYPNGDISYQQNW